jgi:predicted SPOUT superfamily RNA methylase MTH1
MPPLRTPNHPLERHSSKLKVGEYREGVVTQLKRGVAHVEIGVERPALLRASNLERGMRVTVQITELVDGVISVRRVDPSEISIYWGYRVSDLNPTLGQLMDGSNKGLIILTSKYGKALTESVEEIRARWREAKSVLIAFGSPREGLREILAREGLNISDLKGIVVNTIPLQGTESVRTEEAVWATLAVMNAITQGV